MKTSRINIFAGLFAIIYFLFLALPLLKGLFSSRKVIKPMVLEPEWVEEPLMIEDVKCSQ